MPAIINTIERAGTLTVLGEHMRPLLTNEMGSAIEIFATSGDVGMGPPPHAHDWSETYFMLDGELDLMIGDDAPQRLGPGMVAHAPGGTTHAYRIAADGTRFLTILSEGNGHAFFTQMDAEVSMPPNIDHVLRIGSSHGIRFAE